MAVRFDMGCFVVGNRGRKIQSRLQVPAICGEVQEFQSGGLFGVLTGAVPAGVGVAVPVGGADEAAEERDEMGAEPALGL